MKIEDFVIVKTVIFPKTNYIAYYDGDDHFISLDKRDVNWVELALHDRHGYDTLSMKQMLKFAYQLFELNDHQIVGAASADFTRGNPFWSFFKVVGDVNWDKFNGLMEPLNESARTRLLLERFKNASSDDLKKVLRLRGEL